MKIAITGGIGSGKSYVCRILEKQGIRVYDCDDEAKRLMRTDARLQAGLKKLVGEQVYSAEGVLQKPVLAQFLLAGEANKQAVNDAIASGTIEGITGTFTFDEHHDPVKKTAILTYVDGKPELKEMF